MITDGPYHLNQLQLIAHELIFKR